jgi:hypothetical protein
MGTHENQVEVIPSKEERYKNMALILVDAGKQKRQKRIEELANPEDTSLILTQANLYLQTKDYET